MGKNLVRANLAHNTSDEKKYQITKEEYLNLKFQTETSSLNSHGAVRKMPFVFTEQGVAMLATILKTEVCIWWKIGKAKKINKNSGG